MERLLVFVLLFTHVVCRGVTTSDSDLIHARAFLERYNREAADRNYQSALKSWIYYTNITDYNSEMMVKEDLELAQFTKSSALEANGFNWRSFPNATMRREFEFIAEQGTEAMKNDTKLKRLKTVMSTMEGIYGKGTVCDLPPDYNCHELEPDLTRTMAGSRDFDLLSAVWTRWRDISKGDMKQLYEEFVQLSNEGIRDGGTFNDTGEYWRSWYETPTFEDDLKQLLDELKPLYNNLHAYVRQKLKQTYSNVTFPESGHIYAHLLGNMWAQTWSNLYEMTKPFPNRRSIDITPVLKSRNYTAEQMFRTAEEFFVSLGLRPMPKEFWENSMIEKPTDGRQVICHASAWDFSHGNDVRIKMCTDITMEDLITVHHEMGHIQYYLQYQQQPVVFRGGANPGFHEAIGDVMALSVSTPKHLQAIGLLDNVENTTESDINYLMWKALDDIAFLPFGYLIDQWRWSVFRGDTSPEQYTSEWWKLRCKYQGIAPPVARHSDDFDPGAKYHIPGNTPYIRYFVRSVIQFQFHKALCEAAGHTGPLYQCDIYKSKAAGTKLREALKLGASKPWTEVMEQLTGAPNMNTSAMIEYFQPLIDWLHEKNKGENITWSEECPDVYPETKTYPSAQTFLLRYNNEAQVMENRQVTAEWNYGSNITDYNKETMVNVSLETSDFDKEWAKLANQFPWQQFTNRSEYRQFQKITDIGTNALDDKQQLKKMAMLQAGIEGIYGKATVKMSNGKTLALEPGLTQIMTSSRNFSELKEAWVKWRDVSGKKMKADYAEFVELSNRAVRQLNYNDTGAYWRSGYEVETFQEDLEKLLKDLQPLYGLLHAYVRKQLKKTYGAENFPTTGHIPAHLLGNMWGQQWNNIYKLVEPYSGVEEIDVTPEMIKQNYTIRKMFETAEEFFTSLGLSPMPQSFWDKTIMTNPEGIKMVCHASAWDFYNQKDFRIKMCTEINMEELVTVHHEMGHIQYYIQYKDQPVVFRRGANSGFHEAIGDVMALSVSTPGHLRAIGLLNRTTESTYESDINFLMKMSLEKIAFLPFGYLIDQWRWSVFSGETTPQQYNAKWWQLRCKYQGLSPPVERSEDYFDPGAKYHIPANVPYIRYFVSYVLQFHFHKVLCEEKGYTGPLHLCDIYQSKIAGKKFRYFVSFVIQFQFHQRLCEISDFTGPLHKCDIYKSLEAGQKLGDLLRLGSSIPWTEAMMQFAGTDKMSVAPLLEYFKPLIDWLEERVPEEERGWSEECTHVTEADQLQVWLQQYEKEASDQFVKLNEAEWAYNTNITDYNAQQKTIIGTKVAQYQKEVAKNVSTYDWNDYRDPRLKRRMMLMADIGTSALKNETQLKQMKELQGQLETLYSTGKVYLEPNKPLSLEPDLERIISSSTNYEELTNVWKGWRDATGRKMKPLYSKFVDLSNEAVRTLGYADTGAYWRSWYESDTFQTDLEQLLQQLAPLYENLHTYVRKQLVKQYGAEKFPSSGHIPAHILGNMWAQTWSNLYSRIIPFKNKPGVDVTDTLVKQNYNASSMFRTAEEFFTSVGLPSMRHEFWDKSMITKPEGREVVCHASAWDFNNAKDFRIKMCTNVDMEDLITIHHEMGHTQYQMAYSFQPIPFRDGANPGFHEAIGDVISLSVQTPKHLRTIGLLAAGADDEETEINFLMRMALDKIAFLPFGYLIDQWRWSVFSGETTPQQYNAKWWQLRCKFQGISPPVERTEEDFDPGAKFHIPGNYPYIRYFVSFVVQFQFHKSLCDAAGHTGPLHRCDIYRSKVAGEKLLNVLKLGKSKPWPEVMEQLTGQRKMDARAILQYFQPLIKWLEKENYNERPGWSAACPVFEEPPQTTTPPTDVRFRTTNCQTSSGNGIANHQWAAKLLLLVVLFLL